LSFDDHAWMGVCLNLARSAGAQGEVPVGAIVVADQKIIARCFNLRESSGDPCAHAEVLALREAAKYRGHWRLLNTTLYVTLEPCFMCAGALVNARVKRLVFGCLDPKAGAAGSLACVPCDSRLNHRLLIKGGVRADESAKLLRDFFKARRRVR